MDNTRGILFAQVFLLLSLFGFYIIADSNLDESYLWVSILVGAMSLGLRGFMKEYNPLLIRNPFTLTNLFLLAFCITFFQLPIDYLLTSFSNLFKFHHFFYDLSLINRSVLFSVICLVSFNIGQALNKNTYGQLRYPNFSHSSIRQIPIKPFLYISLFLFVAHMASVNMGYYLGTKAPLEGLSLTFHSYFLRFIVIVVFIVIWNIKARNRAINSLQSYFKSFPLLFLIIILVFVLLTLMAADRGPVIRILMLLSIGYFIVAYKKVNLLTFFILIISTGYFLSVIKLVGSQGINEDLIGGFNAAEERFHNSDRIESISPYTIELAGSIYANNILFYLWHSGASLYGSGLIAGVLMAFPGGVSIFSGITGIKGEALNSSILATALSGQDYGVGTTIIGDSLINLGFFGTILVFIILGYIFRKIDLNLYKKKPDFILLLLGIVFIAQVIALPRISVFNLIGVFLFDFVVVLVVHNLHYYKSRK